MANVAAPSPSDKPKTRICVRCGAAFPRADNPLNPDANFFCDAYPNCRAPSAEPFEPDRTALWPWKDSPFRVCAKCGTPFGVEGVAIVAYKPDGLIDAREELWLCPTHTPEEKRRWTSASNTPSSSTDTTKSARPPISWPTSGPPPVWPPREGMTRVLGSTASKPPPPPSTSSPWSSKSETPTPPTDDLPLAERNRRLLEAYHRRLKE